MGRGIPEDRGDDCPAVQAVSGEQGLFLNTERGDLLIGVADDGSIVGIEQDRFDREDRRLVPERATEYIRTRFARPGASHVEP